MKVTINIFGAKQWGTQGTNQIFRQWGNPPYLPTTGNLVQQSRQGHSGQRRLNPLQNYLYIAAFKLTTNTVLKTHITEKGQKSGKERDKLNFLSIEVQLIVTYLHQLCAQDSRKIRYFSSFLSSPLPPTILYLSDTLPPHCWFLDILFSP